eukprot:7228558-Pyramimonas_sp.AAC.2
MRNATSMWVVRHGERIDETAKAAEWLSQTPKSRRFDPPLTEEGGRQATAAGQTLSKLGLSFDTVSALSGVRVPHKAHPFNSLAHHGAAGRQRDGRGPRFMCLCGGNRPTR